MSYEILISLQLFALVSTFTPGSNNIMLMASGMNYGYSKTLPHMVGIGLGMLSLILLVVLGLASLFERVPASLIILKTLCAFYLFYLAWKIATAKKPSIKNVPNIKNTKASSLESRPMTVLEAALFQWLNPKAWTMVITAITLYTPKEKSLESIIIVCAVFAIAVVPSTNAWTLLGRQLRQIINDEKKRRIFNISCALALVASLYPIVAS